MIKMNINDISFFTGNWPVNPVLPSLIFIHGAGNSKNLWKQQIDRLTDYVNTFAIDLPGHGESSGEGMETIADYAECIRNFIKAVNPPEPIPCGLSMGGAITLHLLINSEIEFKGGIIINSGARLKVMPAIFEMINSNYSGYISSLPLMGASSKTDRALLNDITKDAENCRPEVVFRDFTACNTFDITERLNEINIPVLVMTAEEDKLTPQKQGRFLADHIAGSDYVNISDAGHFSPAEKPEEVNEAILKFVLGM